MRCEIKYNKLGTRWWLIGCGSSPIGGGRRNDMAGVPCVVNMIIEGNICSERPDGNRVWPREGPSRAENEK